MYERLPLDFIGVTDNFGARVDPITKVTSYHYGVDLGWNKYEGEKVYAIYDSTLVEEGYDKNLGNYTVFKYDKKNNTIIYRFLHLKNRTSIKVGEKVKQQTVVGYMGSTGYSTGTHLHFEYWICPKGYNYKFSDRGKYAVDPLKHCYLFDNQTANKSINLLTRVLGTSKKKEKDSNKNQIKVVGEFLRARKEAGLDKQILGFIDYGIYDYIEKIEKDNYTWYNLGFCWIAGTKEDTKIYPEKNPEDDKIAELEEQVKKLDTELLVQKTLVEKQKEEIDQLNEKLSNYANLKEHNVDNTEYIKLINGDRIYF